MKVSIITATYNSAKTLQDTINSVYNQSYKNIEHIIQDGGSKDETILIAQAFAHLKIYSEKDKGIYDAMNKGIDKTTGDIIGILNSDDFYASDDVISKVVQLFSNSDCSIVYGDLNYVDEHDSSRIIRKWKAGNFNYKKFKWGWMPPHPTVFVKKEIYDNFGKFNLELKSAADYELMLRFLYKNKVKAAYLPKLLVKMRTGGQSNKSLKNRVFANKEDRKAWKINNVKPNVLTLTLKPLRKIIQYF